MKEIIKIRSACYLLEPEDLVAVKVTPVPKNPDNLLGQGLDPTISKEVGEAKFIVAWVIEGKQCYLITHKDIAEFYKTMIEADKLDGVDYRLTPINFDNTIKKQRIFSDYVFILPYIDGYLWIEFDPNDVIDEELIPASYADLATVSEIISTAASKMGKKGGRSKSQRKMQAHAQNVKNAGRKIGEAPREAVLVGYTARNGRTLELRYACKQSDYWPGQGKPYALGKAGYYQGHENAQDYITRTREGAENILNNRGWAVRWLDKDE